MRRIRITHNFATRKIAIFTASLVTFSITNAVFAGGITTEDTYSPLGLFAGLGVEYQNLNTPGPGSFYTKQVSTGNSVLFSAGNSVGFSPILNPTIQLGYLRPASNFFYGVIGTYDALQALSTPGTSFTTSSATIGSGSTVRFVSTRSTYSWNTVLQLFATLGKQYSWGNIMAGVGPAWLNMEQNLNIFSVPVGTQDDFSNPVSSASRSTWRTGGAVRLDVTKNLTRTVFLDVYGSYSYFGEKEATSTTSALVSTTTFNAMTTAKGNARIMALGVSLNKIFFS